MRQVIAPHIKIELDPNQQLVLANVYKFLIHLAEKSKSKPPLPNPPVDQQLQISEPITEQTEFFKQKVFS